MNWIRVVTEPLGLAAFTLAIVFGAVAVKSKSSIGMKYLAIALSAIAVLGGLGVSAYREYVASNRQHESNNEVARNAEKQNSGKVGSTSEQSPTSSNHQHSEGIGAANVSNVGGAVTINVSGVDSKK